jgi:transcriptional regulator with XRE-family HTH domain
MALGINQAELAEMADLHPSSLNQIEKGKRAPGRETIDRIAKQLKTTRDVIIDGDAAPQLPAPQPAAAYAQSDQVSAAVHKATAEILGNIAHAILDTLATWHEAELGRQIASTGTGTAGGPTRDRGSR